MKTAVIISCLDWYQARIELIREQLINKGYSVTILGSEFEYLKRVPVYDSYKDCIFIHVPEYEKNLSIKRIVSYLAFGRGVRKWLSKNTPDLIYCLAPPNNMGKICKNYKNIHINTKLIMDIIDLWPESIPLRKIKKSLPARIWRKWRDVAIGAADHVFTECDLYQERLRETIDPSKTTTLYLYKDQTMEDKRLVEEIINRKKICNIIRFAYLGTMNNIIDIDGICEVIKWFIEIGKSCELHAIGCGESKEKFEAAVKVTGCQARFYGPVFDEKEKIRILASCDYAFNMMKSEVCVGLTIKSIDYLSYGLPLINNIKGDTWKLVEKEEVGINVSKPVRFQLKTIDHRTVCKVFNNRFTKERFIESVGKIL